MFSSWRRAVASMSGVHTLTGTRPWSSSRAIGMQTSIGRFEVRQQPPRCRFLHARLVDATLRAFGLLEKIVGARERQEAELRRPQLAQIRALAEEAPGFRFREVLQQRAGGDERDHEAHR